MWISFIKGPHTWSLYLPYQKDQTTTSQLQPRIHIVSVYLTSIIWTEEPPLFPRYWEQKESIPHNPCAHNQTHHIKSNICNKDRHMPYNSTRIINNNNSVFGGLPAVNVSAWVSGSLVLLPATVINFSSPFLQIINAQRWENRASWRYW